MRQVIPGVLLSLVLLNGSCSFTEKTTHRLYDDAKDDVLDVIVVPGVPFEGGNWSYIMKGRVYWSKYLYDKGITKNIMYSGSAVYSPYFEAQIMALYAEALGIPKEHIFTETKAEHSTENIYYSYKKAKKLGFKKIGLASDAFQTKMLRGFAKRKLSRDIKFIPIVRDSLEALYPLSDPQIDFKQAYAENFVSLTDREGFWKRFRGTMGKRIDESAYE